MEETKLLTILLLAGASGAEATDVRVVSSRPEMVTGGDVLVEVRGAANDLLIRLDGREVTWRFQPGGGTLLGRLEGLAEGRHRLVVESGRKRIKQELVNHPVSGPLFSGPHQSPFYCETEAVGLGPAQDANCSVRTVVRYYYKSTGPVANGSPPNPRAPMPVPPQFKAFDPANGRPVDLAQTTTTDGFTVDYIVRRETGTINRAIYDIAFLHTPGDPLPDPWRGTKGWNGRLVYAFGGACKPGYRQGRAPHAMSDAVLSLGYASAASSLNVFGNNCDDVLSAETLMMVKEHFIEQFGVPAFTIGVGSSGGSMQQHLIAQNYPGLLDGIVPGASFPDITTVMSSTADCTLLHRAFNASGLEWTPEQKASVAGYATWGTCQSWMRTTYSPAWLQAGACSAPVAKSRSFDVRTNPRGVRCSLYDNQVNVYGRDPATGFARRPFDNIGVQYGLAALKAGKIGPEQFLALNARAGGYDVNGALVAERTAGDPTALRLAYETGRVMSGGGSLGTIPVIDVRGARGTVTFPLLDRVGYGDRDGDIHDTVRSLVTRARLIKNNGSAANQVILTVHPQDGRAILLAMDEWLSNMAKDSSGGSAAARVARNRPSRLTDACWSDEEKIAEARVFRGMGRCAALYPAHGNPRMAAGGPLADDILKCTLKPVRRDEYPQGLTDNQWSRLRAVFPNGVCDYSRPGVEQVRLRGTWIRY